jgi:type IV secretory pathway VirB2 component (pilin)
MTDRPSLNASRDTEPTARPRGTRLTKVRRPRGATVDLRGLARLGRALLLALSAVVLVPAASYAQASPWENAVNVLMTSFTGPIARGLSLVSIVVGGITFAFGEGGSKRLLAGIVFGVGMAIGAVNFMAWLFP